MTGIEPGASVIVTHPRWHEDGLSGWLLRDRDVHWEYVVLPAIADEGTDHERHLWPERWPLDSLHGRRREVGPYDWASLYQQRPQPRGGRLFGGSVTYDRLADLAPLLRDGKLRILKASVSQRRRPGFAPAP